MDRPRLDGHVGEPEAAELLRPCDRAASRARSRTCPGRGSQAGTEPPNLSQLVTLYFDSVVTGESPAVTWSADARVNEGPSGPPNTSVRTASGSTAFDAAGDNDALSFALPGKNVLLGTTNTGKASLRFAVPSSGTDPYETSLAASDSTSFCLDGMTCAPLLLTTSVPGQTNGILVWHFIIPNSPIGAGSLKIVHIYDPVIDVPANATNDTLDR